MPCRILRLSFTFHRSLIFLSSPGSYSLSSGFEPLGLNDLLPDRFSVVDSSTTIGLVLGSFAATMESGYHDGFANTKFSLKPVNSSNFLALARHAQVGSHSAYLSKSFSRGAKIAGRRKGISADRAAGAAVYTRRLQLSQKARAAELLRTLTAIRRRGFNFLRIFGDIFHAVAERADTLAEALSKLWKLFGAENEQRNDQDDQQMLRLQ
jgi:acetolactate synthase regulatory subunit